MAPKDKSTAGGKTEIDKELIRELAKLLDETGLTEIEIEQLGELADQLLVDRGFAVGHALVFRRHAQRLLFVVIAAMPSIASA